jgi:transposase
MANQAKAALGAESLEAFADRGYFKGEEILACEEASITVTLPKASDIGGEVGRALRQAGFPLRG